MLGAQIKGAKWAGGEAEGWTAYPINADLPAPVPWNVESLAFYLRNGWHADHGVSRGPMAEVTGNLGRLPDEDVLAIATYTADVMGAAERRQAMLDVIAGARQRLVLSLFRCNDPACSRRWRRQWTRRQGRSHPHQAREERQEAAAEALGGPRRDGRRCPSLRSPLVYHAKYLVADGQTALVTTLNPTTKCFTRTWDMLLTTRERTVVRSLSTLFALDAAGERVLPRHRISRRLIVGPDGARQRIQGLLASARRSIRILDHKLSDPDLVSLLRERREEGIAVSVIGHQPMGAIVPHGKLIIIDESLVVLGQHGAVARPASTPGARSRSSPTRLASCGR